MIEIKTLDHGFIGHDCVRCTEKNGEIEIQVVEIIQSTWVSSNKNVITKEQAYELGIWLINHSENK